MDVNPAANLTSVRQIDIFKDDEILTFISDANEDVANGSVGVGGPLGIPKISACIQS